MTQISHQPAESSIRARLSIPGAVIWLFIIGPFLMAFGSFVTIAMRPYTADYTSKTDAIQMAWVGLFLLALGAIFLLSGIVVTAVRSLIVRQTELLLAASSEKPTTED